MSLATRCSACSTVFRVQQDQLKASEGWVRCGRCGTVFSALEGLFDLEREGQSGPVPLQHEPMVGIVAAPQPALARSAVPAAVVAPAPRAAPPVDFGSAEPAIDTDEFVFDIRQSSSGVLRASARRDAAAEEAASAASFSAAYPDVALDLDDDAELLAEHSGHHTLAPSRPMDSGPASLTPSFIRESERAARWQRPIERRLTIAAALVLPVILLLQMAVYHRDTLAARSPATAGLLRALCAPLQCSVQAPRALDAVAVDSSGMTRVEGAPLYKLQLSLRNQAGWAVAMPALDLTLTDSRGDVVTRRILRASELSASAPEQLEAGAEWSTLAIFDIGDRRVTGYTIDLFYP